MTKITPDHLARSAFVYVRQSTAMQVAHNLESQRRQYSLADRARHLGWENVEVSMMISADPAVASVVRDLRGCSLRFVKVASARCFRWKPLAWPAMGVTGTRCWSSVVSLARLLSMRTGFMIRPLPMIGFFLA